MTIFSYAELSKTRLIALFQVYQVAHIKYVHLFVCQSYLPKLELKVSCICFPLLYLNAAIRTFLHNLHYISVGHFLVSIPRNLSKQRSE